METIIKTESRKVSSSQKEENDSFSSSPNKIDILRILNSKGPLNYFGLESLSGFKTEKDRGRFAYHFQKLRRESFVTWNKLKICKITNLGKLLLELLQTHRKHKIHYSNTPIQPQFIPILDHYFIRLKPIFDPLSQIMKNKQDFWKSLKAYGLELYQGEALSKLTTVGILKLHEVEMDTSYDNITVILYKLFPEKFSLINFPQYPDTLRVNRALTSHCITAGYVKGNLKTNSYTLTISGRKTAEDLLEKIEAGTKSQTKRSDLKRSKNIRLVQGVTETSGFKKFSSKDYEEIKKFDVCESLHCTIDADKDLIKSNFDTLVDYASDANKFEIFAKISQSVLDYLQYIESNWEKLMK